MAISKDELGNASALDYILKGGGRLYVSDFGQNNFVYIGETHEIAQNFEVTKNSIPSTESCPAGVLLEYVESTVLNINFSSYSSTPENIARFFLGETTAGQTEVSDEVVSITAKKGVYFEVGYINLTDGSVVVSNEDDTVTYVEGTDYVVDYGAGMLGITQDGSIIDGDTIKVTLSAGEAGEEVQYLKGEAKDVSLKFVGCAENGEPVVVDFYKVQLAGNGDAPLKGNEPISIAFTGGCSPDPSKPANGSISQYATMKYINKAV